MAGGGDRAGGPQKADQRDGQDQSRRGGGVPAPEQQPGGGKRRENSREPQRDRVRMERDGEDQAQREGRGDGDQRRRLQRRADNRLTVYPPVTLPSPPPPLSPAGRGLIFSPSPPVGRGLR